MKIYNRLIDANINRVSEGMRAIEDTLRFVFDNEHFSRKLREKRHELRKLFGAFDEKFLDSRDTYGDVGVSVTQTSVLDKKSSTKNLIIGNFKRIQEGLRSIEEACKVINQYNLSKEIENMRYSFYSLEKEIMELIKNPIPEGIYGITAENFNKGKTNKEVVEEMIRAGIKIIQYREKHKSLTEKLKEAKVLADLCKKNNVLFIVNDHIDIALIVDADGVHVGQEDMPVEDIRALLGPKKIIGLSTHSIEDAKNAMNLDIDYIGVGPIYPTTTKDREAVGLEYLEFVEKNINIPYIAIGGIKKHNLPEIVSYGATRVALVSEIVGAENIITKVAELNKIIKTI